MDGGGHCCGEIDRGFVGVWDGAGYGWTHPAASLSSTRHEEGERNCVCARDGENYVAAVAAAAVLLLFRAEIRGYFFDVGGLLRRRPWRTNDDEGNNNIED